MPRSKRQKSFFEMTDAGKTEAAREFDHPLPAGGCKPLTRKQRALWDKARSSKPDVSIFVHGDGGVDIQIHLDPDLLTEARAFAVKNRTSLPKMIDRGLRGLLAFAG